MADAIVKQLRRPSRRPGRAERATSDGDVDVADRRRNGGNSTSANGNGFPRVGGVWHGDSVAHGLHRDRDKVVVMSTAPGDASVAPSYIVCGVRIDALAPHEACAALVEAKFGRPRAVHLCNAYTLSLARRDERFRDLLNRGDLNFADGHPVAAIGRRRGHHHLEQRVYGPDLMLATVDAGRAVGVRHYFYGGSEPVLEALLTTLTGRFPGLEIAGAEAPPFRELTDAERTAARRRITDARPDLVWVGLGTPRQDSWVDAERDQLGTTLVAIGAAFDFLAGAKRQAPRWMQDAGLEWAFRLGSEPRRLWRRYLIGNSVFLAGVAAEEWRERRSRRRP